MKKLLLLLFIFLGFHGFAQQPDRNDVPELVNQAKMMLEEDASSAEGRKYLRIALESEPMNEEVNYLLAKSHLTAGPSQYVENYINQAISQNPENTEYRWIHVQTLMGQMNMLHGTRLKMIDETFKDLDFLIAQDSDIGKAYLIKAYLYNDLGDEWKFKSVEDAALKVSNYKTAVTYYQQALEAFQKAVKIDAKYKDSLDTRAIEFKMNQINSKIAQL